MEIFYLIDFENVQNKGLENIDSLSKTEHVHIFSTKNAINIRMDIVFSKEIDIQGHIVPDGNQSLDMHLVSYLGYLLGIHGKQCVYVIVSKDTDYDNIIKFWKEKGYSNISREQKIPKVSTKQKKTLQSVSTTTTKTVNNKISVRMAYNFSGKDRSDLNQFMQRGLSDKGYKGDDINKICKYVVDHCNDEKILSGIHNDLKEKYVNYREVYKDVKSIFEKFVSRRVK